MAEVSNYDDMIDSRAVIDRIAELESRRECGHCAETVTRADDDALIHADSGRAECAGATDDAATVAELADELDDAERAELAALRALAADAEGYAADWRHGETLIRDSYFVTYAQELAEDIGAIAPDAKWPATCIDWEQAARELQMDYTSVDFDGVTYWIR